MHGSLALRTGRAMRCGGEGGGGERGLHNSTNFLTPRRVFTSDLRLEDGRYNQ